MEEMAVLFARETWGILTDMAPYLLLGFLAVGFPTSFVARHLGGSGPVPVIKASLLGIPLPICSCGVLPLGASLRDRGAGRGATASFLISTPQTGIDSILVTYSLLGPVFALFRPLAALVSGVLGGLTVAGLTPEKEAGPEPAKPCTRGCCASAPPAPAALRALRYGFRHLPQEMGTHILVGLFLAGLVAVLLPPDFLAGTLGRGLPAMAAMMLLGLPVYICATASVPLAAAMMAKGLSPGAALVFLAVGPATNTIALATLWKLLGRRQTLAYLAAVALTALASGLLLDLVHTAVFREWSRTEGGHLLPGAVKKGAALVLAILLVAAEVGKRRRPPHASGDGPG